MSVSPLPLSYCTNVHPGRSVAQVREGLERYTAHVKRGFGKPMAAGLWLARSVVSELLATPSGAKRMAEFLAESGLTCHTLNAFPFGNFHSERVKENVYLPGWARPERLAFTLDCAKVLCELLSPGGEGSISTMPLGFKPFLQPPHFMQDCFHNLIECAVELSRLHQQTGKTVRLAIEPEPCCLLETTLEAIDFFRRLFAHASDAKKEEVVRTHIGLCFDVCHQAVEFEDVAASIRALSEADVRINKVHISCAIEYEPADDNAEGREALRRYIEPRYLHQTLAQTGDGRIARAVDLSNDLLDHPDADFRAADRWRIHFHVPVDAEMLGPLKTTRPALKEALQAVAALDYAPHLEVETYTWEIMPGRERIDLAEALTREMIATDHLLALLQ